MATKIIENRSGSPKSPVLHQTYETARQNRMSVLARNIITDHVGMSREIVNPESFYVPISSVAAGQRLIGKTIHTEIIGKSEKDYGIISDNERFESENGRTLKIIEAKFIDNHDIKKIRVEYDITELVKAGARPEEIPILEFTTDSNGILTYASKQYDMNIDAYKRKTGYDKGVYREGVVGKYNVNSFMMGRQQQEMNDILRETKSGWHVIREINVPFFLSFGLHCKDSGMTNVVVSYIMQDGTLFYGAINNSKQSDREWTRVWIGITKRKFWRIRQRKYRRERVNAGKIGVASAAVLQFAALGAAASMGFSSGADARESRLLAMLSRNGAAFGGRAAGRNGPVKSNMGFSLLSSMGYFSRKAADAINARLASKLKGLMANASQGRLSAKLLYATPAAVLGLSIIRTLDASAMKAVFLKPAKASAKSNMGLATSAYYGIRKGVALVSSKTRKGITRYIAHIAAAFRKEAARINARLSMEANGIMIMILSYVTFGIRRHIEIRNMSYYPYVERLGNLV